VRNLVFGPRSASTATDVNSFSTDAGGRLTAARRVNSVREVVMS
jgi:hypothetical protein